VASGEADSLGRASFSRESAIALKDDTRSGTNVWSDNAHHSVEIGRRFSSLSTFAVCIVHASDNSEAFFLSRADNG
jgi:hypothetical protein